VRNHPNSLVISGNTCELTYAFLLYIKIL